MDSDNTPIEPPQDNEPLRFNHRDQQLILMFLATCLTNAETALAAETPEDKSLLSHPLVRQRMNYWRNVASGIKWCGWLASKRQLFLGVDHDPVLQKRVDEWMNQSPVS